jgi:adenylate cyclase
MAIFGAPVPATNHHEQALLAALEMQRRFRIIKKNWSDLFRIEAGIGIGINSGPAIVGNIGCFHRISYTAIGDTVNTAARYEQLALDNQILFGDSVRERLDPTFLARHTLIAEELARVPIKGKKGVHTIHNLRTAPLDAPAR